MTHWSTILDGFVRAYPLFIVFYSFTAGLLNNSNENIVFGIILLIADSFNHLMKQYIFRPLMGDGGRKGILGIGSRPPNCKNSGLFKDGKISRSYGMPSGHAQTAWLFTTYWILKIAHDSERSRLSKLIAEVSLCVVSFMIAYSRVQLRCHTWQQALVGSIIGIGLGVMVYQILVYIFPEKSKNAP